MSVQEDEYRYLTLEDIRPQPIVTASGHARAYNETLEWLRPKLRHVPITRLVDLTPLDYLQLPVWQAVTPLNRDLTVHAGKGATDDAAKLSAIMEAIERTSGEKLDAHRVIRTSYAELCAEGKSVLDPRTCSLPYESAFRPDGQFSWVTGYNLLDRGEIWVPSDLVTSPPSEGVWTTVETNGLASGNTHLEAIVHGLNELIERDAETLRDIVVTAGGDASVRKLFNGLVDFDTLPAIAKEWAAKIAAESGKISIIDITSDIGIPVYQVSFYDPTFPSDEYLPTFGGVGCDISPTRAVMRALTEAVQAHSVLTSGARDTFETGGGGIRTLTSLYEAHCAFGAGVRPFREEPQTIDLYEILQQTLKRLERAGFDQVICVDVTRASLAVPVVRMILPGACHPVESAQALPPRALMRLVGG